MIGEYSTESYLLRFAFGDGVSYWPYTPRGTRVAASYQVRQQFDVVYQRDGYLLPCFLHLGVMACGVSAGESRAAPAGATGHAHGYSCKYSVNSVIDLNYDLSFSY